MSASLPSWWVRQGARPEDEVVLRYDVTYAQLAAAATTNDIELFVLPAGFVISAIKIKHSTSFSGTGITAYTVSVGIAADLDKYASPWDVLQAVAATTFQLSAGLQSESHTGTTSVRIAATSTGANLNAASGAGALTVWVSVLNMA